MEGLILRKGGYERYGLTGNPFRDLSSDSIENVDIFHVHQSIDDSITNIMEEVVAGENKAIVAILGKMGSGKTTRLLLAKNLAERENFFYVYRNMNTHGNWITKGIADEIINKMGLGAMSRIFSAPKWYKSLSSLEKTGDSYDADTVGRAMAEALNANSPAFLMLNDLHNISSGKDIPTFVKMFHVLLDNIEPGVLILVSSDKTYFDNFMESNPSLSQRINRKIDVPLLQIHEASLLLAKRLLVKRLVEDMDPIYPFTESAVAMMNAMAEGNPRLLIKFADIALEQASARKVMRVDENIIAEVVSTSAGEPKIKKPETARSEKMTKEEMEESLKNSYLQGKISKEMYISNLKKLRDGKTRS